MYLSEEKRTDIRACIEKQMSYQKKTESTNSSKYHDTVGIRMISQILFGARDRREMFILFS